MYIVFGECFNLLWIIFYQSLLNIFITLGYVLICFFIENESNQATPSIIPPANHIVYS